ncbi:MAG TPA: MMPL family transporter, partial [Usitatibacter sp.]|nr:MMPL family transporter [Usitatibacter sp.]
LLGIEGADAAVRADLSRAVASTLRRDARFTLVANGSAEGLAAERDFVVAHRYALSPRVNAERFTVQGLRAAVGETLDLLASSAGLLVKPLVARDPTGETLAVLESLQGGAGPRVLQGAWSDGEGRRAVLLARTRASGADVDAQAAALDAIHQAFDAAAAAAGPAARGTRIGVTGPGAFSARSRALVKGDVVRLSTLAMAAVATMLLLVYRSALALVLGLLPVVTGAVVGVAAVSAGFGVVHGITLGFGATLIGEAVDYAIYLFVQAGARERAADANALRGFWPTIRLGVLTSIAGFCALVFSGLPGLAQLGVYSIAGLVAAALVTRHVLPSLLPANFRVRDLSVAGARIAAFAGRLRRLAPGVLILAGMAIAVLAWRGEDAWDDDLASLNPISSRDRALDARLRSALGASDARHMVVIRGASADAAVAGAERVGAALDAAVAAGALEGYESPARFVPSLATQRARLAALPDAPTLRARLAEALQGLPLRADRLEPFVAEAAAARDAPPITPDTLEGTAFAPLVKGMLFRDANGTWTALVGLRIPRASVVDPRALRTTVLGTGVQGATFLDVKAELDRLYAGYLRQALLMSGLGLAVIVALLAMALRDARRVARVMVPLAAGVAVVAAGHVLLGTRLSILHLMGLLLVVAVGSNYALFLDRVGRGGGATGTTLASLVLANATTVASFGMLALSSIPLLSALGSTVAAGAFLTLVFSAAFAAPAPVDAPNP